MNANTELATKLATTLRNLADACEAAAKGDEGAQALLIAYTDNHWNGLVVGANEVAKLFTPPEDTSEWAVEE